MLIRFDELELPEVVNAGIRDAGFVTPTPIQAKTLPHTLKGEDVAGQAQTGTGKTAAFLITIFKRLLETPSRQPGLPRALVIAPTRELALQIHRDAELLGKHTGLTMTVIFGGMDYHKQRESIRTGADIVIATPGRLMDYHRQKVLILSNIEVMVIDEADRMFDMGFIKDVRFILKRLPPPEARQTLLFSATLNLDVMELAYEHMNAPYELSVEPERITAEGVEQTLFHVEHSRKFRGLMRLLAAEKPDRVIVFANTKGAVEMVTRRLTANDYKAEMLSGDIPQRKRLKIVTDFKEGRLQVLVATDVASRGLHVPGVSHVVNYDLPQDAEDYVHRIGRTARAGATGKAVALVDEDSAFNLESIQKLLGIKIEVGWLDDYPDVEEKRAPPRPYSDRPQKGGYGRGGDRPRERREPRRARPRPEGTRTEGSGSSSGSAEARPEGAKQGGEETKRRRQRSRPAKTSPQGTSKGKPSGPEKK